MSMFTVFLDLSISHKHLSISMLAICITKLLCSSISSYVAWPKHNATLVPILNLQSTSHHNLAQNAPFFDRCNQFLQPRVIKTFGQSPFMEDHFVPLHLTTPTSTSHSFCWVPLRDWKLKEQWVQLFEAGTKGHLNSFANF